MSVRCDYLGRRYIEVPAFPADSLEDPFAKSPFACQDCGTALVYGAVRYFQRNIPLWRQSISSRYVARVEIGRWLEGCCLFRTKYAYGLRSWKSNDRERNSKSFRRRQVR